MAIDTNRITNTIDKLRKVLKKERDLMTPKQVHDLRTRIRRFEASDKALNLQGGEPTQRLVNHLADIRKAAGKVRDMDVLTSHMLGLQFDDHRECALCLVQHLVTERHRLAKKLRDVVAKYGKPARKQLKRFAKDFSRGCLDGESEPKGAAAARVLELASQLASPSTLNRGNLHPYRLKVKELRYVLQTAQGDENQRFVDALGKAKDSIGEWHDWEELIVIAEDLLNDGPSCPVLVKLKYVSQHRFDCALDLTNRMRKEFIGRTDIRNAGKSKRRTKIKGPTLQAVAAIAS